MSSAIIFSNAFIYYGHFLRFISYEVIYSMKEAWFNKMYVPIWTCKLQNMDV